MMYSNIQLLNRINLIQKCTLLFVLFWLFLLPKASISASHELEAVYLTPEEQAWIQQNPEIVSAASDDWPPFDFVDSKGEHVGIIPDYLNLIASKTGLKIRYELDLWDNSVEKIKSKKIDVIGGIAKTEERKDFLNFTTQIYSLSNYFFVHKDLNVKTFEDLNGKKVAIPRNFAAINIIEEHFPLIEVFETETHFDAIDAVIERKADMLLEHYSVTQYSLEKEGIDSIVPFKSARFVGENPMYLASRKDDPILAKIIQKGLDAITRDERQSIQRKWLNTAPNKEDVNISFTQKEKDWIKANKKIVYGAEKEWAPFDFVDQNGNHQGLARSYLDEINKQTGIKFEAKIAPWEQLIKDIKKGEIDLLPAVFFLPERKDFLNYSMPYAASTPYFYGLQEKQRNAEKVDAEKFEHKIVAVTKGYFLITVIKEKFPLLNIKEVDNLTEAVSMLIDGRADFVADSQAALNFYLKKNGISSIHPIQPVSPSVTNEVYMASAKPQPELASIISKIINGISLEEKQQLSNQWLGVTADDLKVRMLLTAEENEWLKEHPVISFAGDPDWLPFESLDREGNYIGMVAEHLNILETYLGITFDVVKTESWNETLDLFEQGKVNVISQVVDSKMPENQKTRGYLSSPIIILMRDKTQYMDSVSSLSDKKVGVIKDYGYVDKIERDNPKIKFVKVDNLRSGLLSLSTGELDAMLSTAGSATFQMSDMGLNNIRIVGKTAYTTSLGFAVTPEYKQLLPILNKALSQINPKDKKRIQDSWGEERFTTKIDYSMLWKALSLFAIIGLVAWFWIIRLGKEVKRRKQSEERLSSLNKRFNMAADAASLGVWEMSASNNTDDSSEVSFDHHMRNIFEFSETEPVTWGRWYKKVHPEDKHKFDGIKELAKLNQTVLEPFQFRTLSDCGDIRYIYSAVSLESSDATNSAKLVGVNWDITHLKRTELALVEAKKQADQANKAKSEFLANMSHEIRTPMNSIIGFTELLDEQVKEKRLKAFIKTIKSAGKSLLELINDILDLSKIEAGKLKIIQSPCNPHDLLNDISNIFVLRVREKNIDLIMEVDEKIPKSLLLDETRVRQILFNLVGNAVKFTEEGFIKIKARTDNENNIRSKLDLIIDVQDTGIGISKDQSQIVFGEFEQSMDMDAKKYGGTGLGLAISSRLAKMMEGEITLKSELGKGSVFSLRLGQVDVASVEAVESSSQSKLPTHKRYIFEEANILVADDVRDNRELLLSNFEETNIIITTAENGQEAVDWVNKKSFDLIFMDIRMPVMNGYDAAEAIKKISPNTPVIALTASVMVDEFERLKSNNFDGYLRKPVLRSDLFNEVSQYVKHTQVDLDEDPVKIILTQNDALSLSKTLPQFKEMIETCNDIAQSNNIADINEFANKLGRINDEAPVKVINQFVNDLKADVDSFNIAGIKNLLARYPILIDELESKLI